MTQEEVAKTVGKSRAAIANSVRLLSLTDEIKAMLSDGRLTSGHARALITITDPNRQNELANLIVDKNLTVRDSENLQHWRVSPRKNRKKKTNDKRINRDNGIRRKVEIGVWHKGKSG